MKVHEGERVNFIVMDITSSASMRLRLKRVVTAEVAEGCTSAVNKFNGIVPTDCYRFASRAACKVSDWPFPRRLDESRDTKKA